MEVWFSISLVVKIALIILYLVERKKRAEMEHAHDVQIDTADNLRRLLAESRQQNETLRESILEAATELRRGLGE